MTFSHDAKSPYCVKLIFNGDFYTLTAVQFFQRITIARLEAEQKRLARASYQAKELMDYAKGRYQEAKKYFRCCGDKEYDVRTHCCINGEIFSRASGNCRLSREEKCKDIRNEYIKQQKVLNNMFDMFLHWQPGETWLDYGFVPAANVIYNYDVYYTESWAFQKSTDKVEGIWRPHNWYQAFFGMLQASVGFYSFGIHGVLHNTTAEEQFYLSWIAIEIQRKEWQIQALEDMYNDLNCDRILGQRL